MNLNSHSIDKAASYDRRAYFRYDFQQQFFYTSPIAQVFGVKIAGHFCSVEQMFRLICGFPPFEPIFEKKRTGTCFLTRTVELR